MKISDIPKELEEIRTEGRFRKVRDLRMITASRGVDREGKEYIVFNSNDYLGMTHEKEVEEAARNAIAYGTGSGGARLTSGAVFELSDLEKEIAAFKHKEDAVIFNTGYMTNLGVLYALAGPGDVIFSDALNHASIIDGVRLCKAVRYRYANADMAELEDCLKKAQAQRFRIIVTDGVFSMDGNAAPLDEICKLAEKYDALVMVDECHSAGVLGKTGRGITELYNLRGQVDILTGTLGKAFGGGVGGFTPGRKEIIDMLRQRSRPYLFSNSLPPAVVGASIEMFKMLGESDALHDKLVKNVEHFRKGMMAAGFDIKPTQSAICAVMLYDAKLSQDFAARLQDEGIFVTGFYYPVVPKGQARIRVQVSAGHTTEQLDRCIAAFVKIGKEMNVIK